MPDELPVGASLLQGQFVIDSHLGSGGFGITYVARNSLGRQVAVKECFPSSICRRHGTRVSARSQSRAREFHGLVSLFRQEAINLSVLDHPNVVGVHQVFQDNGTAYMAMDLIRGPDLLQVIEGTAPPLSPARIMMTLRRLLDALDHVHAHGLLHRDVSPDNILLDEVNGEPILIDFGAAIRGETAFGRIPSDLRAVKDGYSPHEFYIEGSEQTPSCDLYALAATFSHLITGEEPKSARERLSSIASRNGDPQRPLLGRVNGYPPAFLAALDKALSILTQDRMQSAMEWRATLDDVQTLAPLVLDVPEQEAAVESARRLSGRWLLHKLLGRGEAG